MNNNKTNRLGDLIVHIGLNDKELEILQKRFDEQKFDAQLKYLDRLIQLRDDKSFIFDHEFDYYGRLKRLLKAIEKTIKLNEEKAVPLGDFIKSLKPNDAK